MPVRGGLLHAGRWRPDAESERESAGAPSVVLAVHGVTASHMNWAALAAGAPWLDVVAPDLRGRGGSAGLPGPAGLYQHADDLLSLLDTLELERVVVTGHSMGGLASVVFADRYPGRVEKLVLVDGGLPLSAPAGMSTDEIMNATLGPAAERLSMVFDTRENYREYWRSHPAFADGLDESMTAYFDYDIQEVPEGFASRVSLERVREDVASQFAPDVLPPALERLRVPAVFLRAPRGLFDEPQALYSREEAQEWEARLPLLSCRDIPDVNHYTILFDDRPIAIVAAELT